MQCQKEEMRYCTVYEGTAHNKVQCILNTGCTGVSGKQRTKRGKRTVSVTAQFHVTKHSTSYQFHELIILQAL